MANLFGDPDKLDVLLEKYAELSDYAIEILEEIDRLAEILAPIFAEERDLRARIARSHPHYTETDEKTGLERIVVTGYGASGTRARRPLFQRLTLLAEHHGRRKERLRRLKTSYKDITRKAGDLQRAIAYERQK